MKNNRKFILNFCLTILISSLYWIGGVKYSGDKFLRDYNRAVQETDVNRDGIDVEEAINFYKKLGDNNEELLDRIGWSALENYLKKISSEKEISFAFEMLKDYFRDIMYNKRNKIKYRKSLSSLVDVKCDGLSEKDVINAFKIAYNGGKIKRLEIDIPMHFTPKKDAIKSFELLLCPYLLHEGTELDNYFKKKKS
jgi:hypothetical protein